MNKEIFKKTFVVKSEHVDFQKKMKIPVLMRLFQESCIAHTEELGFGRKKTLDKGLLWIICNERILINRLPNYDEEIFIECSPGPRMHYFFPRNFLIKDNKGNIIIKISALRALIKSKTRQIIDPEKYKILIDGIQNESDISPIINLPPFNSEATFEYLAKYSQVDINGHLNNSSYLEIALDKIYELNSNASVPKEINIIFKKEITLNEKIIIDFLKENSTYRFSCEKFALLIKY